MTLKLGVLDQSPVRGGTTPAQAIAETVDLAKFVDGLGYSRYWVAEHHAATAFAGPAPEILVGKLAEVTHHIRVGSGGVMLMHYSPFKVAEQFRMLETLYPGRIDLGIGRAPGTDGRGIMALGSTAAAQNIDRTFPYNLDLLVRYLEDAGGDHEGGIPDDHPLHGVTAMPTGATFPEVWILGSGLHSAVYAATLGQSFCHAQFFNPEGGSEVADVYRERFQPSLRLAAPRLALAVSAIVADTQKEAERLSLVPALWGLRARFKHEYGPPFTTLEEAENYPYTDEDRARIKALQARGNNGTPDVVRSKLEKIVAEFGAEELMIVTITHDHNARRRSYELLAKAFGLEPRAT
ncbi:MAG: LLM class flavin-dependent oxidoreductase [Alphaproteobacteria bacterium]